jgi:Dolichyl-phosphate-mannose-protein mannosyltransferase
VRRGPCNRTLSTGQPSQRSTTAAFIIVAILLVGCTLLGGHLLTGSHGESDESAYLYFAHNLIHGEYAVSTQQNDGLYLWHGPGLPLILAPLVALDLSVHVMRLVGPASLLVAGILFMLMLRRWVSGWLALIGGIVLALFPPFLRLLPSLYSEPVALALFVGGLLALVKAHETGRARWCVTSGALVGFSVLTRVDEGFCFWCSRWRSSWPGGAGRGHTC